MHVVLHLILRNRSFFYTVQNDIYVEIGKSLRTLVERVSSLDANIYILHEVTYDSLICFILYIPI